MKRYLIIISAILSIYSNISAGSSVYCWVDQLSLRKEPSAASEIIMFLKEGDEVVLLESDLGSSHAVILRGMKFYTKWSKVNVNGVEGFVYSGGIESYKGKMAEIVRDYQLLYEKYCKELHVRNYSNPEELIHVYYQFPKKAMKLLMENRSEESHSNYDAYAKAVLDAIEENYKKILSGEFYERYSISLLNGGGVRSGYFLFLYDRFLGDKISKIEKKYDNIYKINLNRKYSYIVEDPEGSGIGSHEVPTIVSAYRITNITQVQFNEINPDSFELDVKMEAEIHLLKKSGFYFIESVDENIVESRIVFSK